MDSLTHLGWTAEFTQKWNEIATPGLQPGRVMADFGTSLTVATPETHSAVLSGKLAHYAHRDGAPKVGDWVAVRSEAGQLIIEALIPRKNELARKVTGPRTARQVMATNIDIAFVILALDGDFSIERLRRYLFQLSADHIEPVIVLNKADKTDQVEVYVKQLDSLGLPVLVTTATRGTGVNRIIERITPGATAVLIGSSGVGKSTLTNQLLGADIQPTQSVRASDATGKHTTVHRELFILPNGGLLIDTPGIRELQLWGAEEDLDESYGDIAALIKQCLYTDCQHKSDKGCAIQNALHTAQLSVTHWENYLKMKQELKTLDTKKRVYIQMNNKKSHKKIHKRTATELKEIRDEMNGT